LISPCASRSTTSTIGPDQERCEHRIRTTQTVAGRRIAEIQIDLTETKSSPGFVNGHPMLQNRYWPAIESDGSASMDELVTMRGYDGEIADVWAGEADIKILESPTEELFLLQVIGGYYHRGGVSWKGGTTLMRNTDPADGEH
jgi:Acetoacetate decarboxylase (ADC)